MNRYILHLDGDAFFASVERASDPRLLGKPVVTGGERGIVTSATIEAKNMGIIRGMPIFQVKRDYPLVVVRSGNFSAYRAYSARMIAIVRGYVDLVEEYSIDECFADISSHVASTDEALSLLHLIQKRILSELGVSVSLGCAPTKVLAKIASKRNKPFGVFVLTPDNFFEVIADTKIASVWGIGRVIALRLGSMGVSSVLDFYSLEQAFLVRMFTAPIVDIYREIHGVSTIPLVTDYELPKSILRSRTIVPSSDRLVWFSEVSYHAELVARELRRIGMYAGVLSVFLKTQKFEYFHVDMRLAIATGSSAQLSTCAIGLLDKIYKSGTQYRSSGVLVSGLSLEFRQGDLFGSNSFDAPFREIESVIDFLPVTARRTIGMGASLSSRLRKSRFADAPTCPFLVLGLSSIPLVVFDNNRVSL